MPDAVEEEEPIFVDIENVALGGRVNGHNEVVRTSKKVALTPK